jgi:pimeloyl-ACP methyl ester carboxylesterase
LKKLKDIVERVKNTPETAEGFNSLLWQLICYPPKMPVRFQNQQLLDEAEKFSLQVPDDYFTGKELRFNGFKWGNGPRKLLITTGWGSKAADFGELIQALRTIGDIEIIAFDAPGNGSSEGELSNLLLFILSVEAIIHQYGEPGIVIGHSLGAMANIMALGRLNIKPGLLVSITPLTRLKENFAATMTAVNVSDAAQEKFFSNFEEIFKTPADAFNLNEQYQFNVQLNHRLAYDINDKVAPYPYLNNFLDQHPSIRTRHYPDAGHEKIIKLPALIEDLLREVRAIKAF